MSCTFNYKGETLTEAELEQKLAEDGKKLSPEQGDDFTKGGLEADINRLESVHKQIISRVYNAYKLSQPQNAEEARRLNEDKKAGKDTHNVILERLKNELDALNENDKKMTIFKFVQWAGKTLPAIAESLDKLSAEGKLDQEMVLRIKAKNQIYDLLDDVIAATENYQATDAVKEGINGRINKIKAIKNSIDSKILEAEKVHYAKMMVKNSNRHLVQWRDKYGKMYDAIQPQEEKIPWVERKMNENMEEINEKAYQIYLKRAEESVGDLNAGMARFVTEKNLNSAEIQVASKMMDNADFATAEFAKSEAVNMKTHYDNFVKTRGGVNREDMYKEFIEQTDEGSYLISEYTVDFIKERNKIRTENTDPVSLQELYGDINVSENGMFKIDNVQYSLIRPKGATGFKVKGQFASYKLHGETYHKNVLEMIGASRIKKWENQNTIKSQSRGGRIPTNNWLNPKFAELTEMQKETLADFRGFIDQANEISGKADSLIEAHDVTEWHRLPGITRTTMSRVLAGDLKSAAIDKITDIYKRKDDEFDVGETSSGKDKNIIKVLTDINNKEKMLIPTGNRAKLKKSDQSLDLHSILLINLQHAKNFQQKKNLEAQILVMADILTNRYVPKQRGVGKKEEVHSFKSLKDMKVFKSKGDLPVDARKLLDMAENRIYGIKSKDAGEVAGMNVQKATSAVLKYAGSVSLIGNFMNSFVNATTGTMNNLIEAVGGETYNLRDWKTAGVKYWKDAKGHIDDIGNNVATSRTSLFNNLFSTLGSSEALNNNFEDNNRVKAIMKTHNLRPIATAGEHMMQSKVMYAVMNNIKILDAQGHYLDRDGKRVATKKEAASIDDVISFVNDKTSIETVIPDFVKGTTFSPGSSHTKILQETKGLIKKKIIDLHGNYDSELQSAAQREWWGKAVFFLKKWMESTTLRRWRGLPKAFKKSDELREVDKFYSEDLKSYQEGYYVTAVRFTTRTLPNALKSFSLELLKADFNKMTSHEKANMKRFIAEMGAIAITMLAYAAMGGLDDEPDESTLMARYYLRREISELTFYSNPAEALKIAKNPSAAINFIERITKMVGQAFSPTEIYDTGKNKGRSKLWVKTLKALPVSSQTEKDFEASLRFLQVME